MADNNIKRQWDVASEIFVEFVRSGKNYYSEFLNYPALERMVGDVKGKRVLDLGCGEGSTSRLLARAGADVTGIDISEGLIEAALDEEDRNPLGIRYIASDAADLPMLESGTFDLAVCYMAMMDIRDYDKAISEASRLLKDGGRFVIVMEHPCFTASRILDGKAVSGWETRVLEDGSKEYLRYWVEDYLKRHSYTFEWRHDRLSGSFETTGFHRTLSDYVKALSRNGFVITDLDEPQPVEGGVRAHPPMKKHYRVPQSIAIGAIKFREQTPV